MRIEEEGGGCGRRGPGMDGSIGGRRAAAAPAAATQSSAAAAGRTEHLATGLLLVYY